jgi:LPPG:FO 2-phospho-L-lactate transferase
VTLYDATNRIPARGFGSAMADGPRVLAFAGGVGGAKLALGLYRQLSPDRLTVIVNTGDDEEIHGLHISPDLDTVMYTLAGVENPEAGWGRRADTFAALAALEALGGEAWFRLGDSDLGTHLRRTELLNAGWTLSAITAEFCRSLGIGCTIAPMSDERVRTLVLTRIGAMSFQEYFVHQRCEPVITGLRFDGAESAYPSPAFRAALAQATTVVFCPSNPFVSIGPILAIPGVREAIANFTGARLAVSPIIGGRAVKGPAAKMLAELGDEQSAVAVARKYEGLCDVFVMDTQDESLSASVSSLGMRTLLASTLMTSEQDKIDLARVVLRAADIS